jgi:predicted nuclease of predicted toxin-antitoxin system
VVKLLLDEMYPAAVAEGLRRDGLDARATQEAAELRGLPDLDLFIAAQFDGRCLVTENIADFVRVESRWRTDQRVAHHGLVLVSPAEFPRPQRVTIGRLVRALGALVSSGGVAPGAVVWLSEGLENARDPEA